MPIPSAITDLSTTAASNSPTGADTPTEGDNHLRTAYAFIRQLYDGITASGSVTSLALADTASVSNGDALVGVNNGNTNEVGRTLHYWIKASRRNLCNFLTTTEVDDGLSGTGAIDISTKFQYAMDAAAGKFLDVPEGRWRADNMSSSTNYSIIAGQGFATRISAPSAANNVFTMSGAFSEIRDLKIDAAVTRSGGRYVDLGAGASRFVLKDFYFDGFLEAIRTAAAATVTIQGGMLLNGVATTGTLIRITDGFDVTVRDVISDQAGQLFAGIIVLNAGDLTVEDCNLIHAGQALYLNPQAGQNITSVWTNNCFFDNSTRGLYAFTQGGAIARCIFDQTWFSSSANQGAMMQTATGTIRGMYFNGCQFLLNGSDGLYVNDTGITDVHIDGGSAAQNTAAGYHFAGNVTKFSVRNTRSGSTDGLLGNTHGVLIDAGTSADNLVTNNILTGNTVAPMTDGGTGTGRVSHTNPDYDSNRATYDPPNLADGAGVTTTVSCLGAALGDFAQATFSLDLQGITLTAWVSAASVVSVRFQNESGGAIDLASGTLRVNIRRAS